MPPSNAEFWHWAAARYGAAPEAWLAVQTAGGNVNLALLLTWYDEAGAPAPALALLEQAIAPLETILYEFRALRRRLKPKLIEEDYQALLAHELALEREQQAGLLAVCANASPALAVGMALNHYLVKLGLAVDYAYSSDYAALIEPTIDPTFDPTQNT